MNFELKKSVEDKKQVFGCANVAEDEQGNTIKDYQGDNITDEELERTAYDYVLKFRDIGERHNPALRKKGKMIESIVFTKEKRAAARVGAMVVSTACNQSLTHIKL